MHLQILAVGKVKEKFCQAGIAEYEKRLTPLCRFTISEVADEAVAEGAPEALLAKARQKEGERLLAKIPADAYVIALAIEGKSLSSPAFAAHLEQLALSGKKEVIFLIGGSWGLAPAVLKRADYALSFGAMTYPHQLMRLILCEQIYRAFKINRHEPYHK